MLEGIDVMPVLSGLATGFAGAVLQPLFSYFNTKQQNKFELQRMEMQAKLQSSSQSHELTMHEKTADDQEHRRLLEHAKSIVQGTLQAMVRPLYALTLLAMFVLAKIAGICIGIYNGESAIVIMQYTWDPATQGLMAACFAYYFGQRNFSKALAMTGGR